MFLVTLFPTSVTIFCNINFISCIYNVISHIATTHFLLLQMYNSKYDLAIAPFHLSPCDFISHNVHLNLTMWLSHNWNFSFHNYVSHNWMRMCIVHLSSVWLFLILSFIPQLSHLIWIWKELKEYITTYDSATSSALLQYLQILCSHNWFL